MTTGIGMTINVLLSNFFDIFELRTLILAQTFTVGILLIWISCGIWLLIWAYTSSRIEALPHVEGVKEFLAFTSKEIEEQIKKYTVSKEDEEKLRNIVKLLNQYLSKEVKYSKSS
jgi:hypothetical protein